MDWPDDQYVARRDFVKFMVLTSLAFVVGQVVIGVQNWFRGRRPQPGPKEIATLGGLRAAGGVQVFHYPEQDDRCLLVLLRDDEGNEWPVAYDQRCTHLSCDVIPHLGEDGNRLASAQCQLHCPCHHGVFDAETGRPIAGPPRRPLPLVKLKDEAGRELCRGKCPLTDGDKIYCARRGGADRMKHAYPREQRMLIVNGMLCLVLILVVLQLWLLTATMNAFLGGDQAAIWPAVVASLVCFGLNAGLLNNLYVLDHLALNRPAPRGNEGNALQLTLATGAFTVCFAVFGSVSAMMPTIQENLKLSATQVGIALAVPVLLGSLGRIPLGMLADRYGSRRVTIVVLVCTIIPGLLVGFVTTYPMLLVFCFFLGFGLASFAAAAPLASGWYPQNRQGAVLGVYGMGNIGQSIAALAAPMMAAASGYYWGFGFSAVLAFLWLAAFWMLARDGRRAPPRRSGSCWSRCGRR